MVFIGDLLECTQNQKKAQCSKVSSDVNVFFYSVYKRCSSKFGEKHDKKFFNFIENFTKWPSYVILISYEISFVFMRLNGHYLIRRKRKKTDILCEAYIVKIIKLYIIWCIKKSNLYMFLKIRLNLKGFAGIIRIARSQSNLFATFSNNPCE